LAQSTLTSKGQITIPKKIRDALGLDDGARVTFIIREAGGVGMRPESGDLVSLYGIPKPEKKGVSLHDMEDAISREAQVG